MIIKAGENNIQVGEIYSENVFLEGAVRPGLRINLNAGISDEQIEALVKNDWHLFENDSDVELSVQTGFNRVHQHQITFIKMGEAEEKIASLEKELAETKILVESLKAEKELLKGIKE